MPESYNARKTLAVGDDSYQIFSLDAVGPTKSRLPYALRILLENLLRHEDGEHVTRAHIEALANWEPRAEPDTEIPFTPARVILQDFTGVPAIVDLAAMRDAMVALGGDPAGINPLSPAELVIDHSVQVDDYGSATALLRNNEIEFKRNRERYAFLRWGQRAFQNFSVVPPNTGIVHQVNLEYLARVVFDDETGGVRMAYPDTLVGTDSHTTMINGLGILGWGVGGIEAEAAMLGQPVTMLIPQVLGFRLSGNLPEGATATDLVLTVTEMLREQGVVGKFVEFFGEGLGELPLADRATIGNMSPEFGSTCAIFPIDTETIRYLQLSGRDPERVALVEAYARAQGLWREATTPDADYSDILELDLGSVEPSLAGPRRPQDRIPLRSAKHRFREHLSPLVDRRGADTVVEARFEDEGGDAAVGNPATGLGTATVSMDAESFELQDGAVLIAAITSCTNTSNPAVMMGAGLLARNAVARGLTTRPWVKTSLAPGSKVVTDYLQRSGLQQHLEALGFFTVGYGCTTCIGNSGPLRHEIAEAVAASDIVGCAVLSGNRNFEGRIHPQIRMNFLASPPLVVAYAIAGTLDIDLYEDPLGHDNDGQPVYLRDLWPSTTDIQTVVESEITAGMFRKNYADVFAGDEHWNALDVPEADRFEWTDTSTYIRKPPYFDGISHEPAPVTGIRGARVLALLGDTVTTDHISPAGSIAANSPAARYLSEHGVRSADFNSYGSRRGNHEIMMRGTFANIRLRNLLVPGTEGGVTEHIPSGERMAIFDAAMRYQAEGTPLIVIAGTEYGTGSSRDWAAKGTLLLGVRAVIAQSFERIHRSNLIGMGVLPLQFEPGDNAASLQLTGRETFEFEGLEAGDADTVQVTATPDSGNKISFRAFVRIDTPMERAYFRHGGILHYVLRQLAARDR